MKINYSQKLEMQIPRENTYFNPIIMSNFDEKFNKLSNNYQIHNEKDVKTFIKEHEDIIDYIEELTPLINDYFPKYLKIIEFCKDPEFDELDFIMIYIKGESFEKDYETLNKFKNEPLYMSKFSKNIKGLLCVELW